MDLLYSSTFIVLCFYPGGRTKGGHGECRMEDLGESAPGRRSGLSWPVAAGGPLALGRVRGGRR